MRCVLVIIIIFLAQLSYSQSKQLPVLHDTTDAPVRYIDFSNIDTIDLWSYDLILNQNIGIKDSLNKIGNVVFFRTAKMKTLHGLPIKPYIHYAIYESADAVSANLFSQSIKDVSSCFMLRGGEKLRIGNYILVNANICSGFLDYKGREVCLPMVDYLLSTVRVNPEATIVEILKKLPVKETPFSFSVY